MKTILVYNPMTKAPNGFLKILQKRLIETLRFQGIPFEKSRTESIIIGDTKVLFYEAIERNARAFTRRHQHMDVTFYTHHANYKKDKTPACLVEQQFLSAKTPILSANYDLAFLELANHILELKTKPMYHVKPSQGTASLVQVPVGMHNQFYFPASQKEEVLKLLETCHAREVRKKVDLEASLQEQEVKMKRIQDSIAELK
ncbi:hypothetical protein JMA_42560 (plasmid) [Jeotgalibacillus malaysiensis]|uniref:Uncharacterized protein n=1 Tax=Jeotgalibacillus malaysiensis TaxID=1508404 RepID=A0A0B5AYI4_9BACL|nr:hypothetical protein [Jeotgalibacillus malaysiensis]AJD93573.1 hypothetical protein JMA_42560 [Jeotgalibacillus malaysiensis]